MLLPQISSILVMALLAGSSIAMPQPQFISNKAVANRGGALPKASGAGAIKTQVMPKTGANIKKPKGLGTTNGVKKSDKKKIISKKAPTKTPGMNGVTNNKKKPLDKAKGAGGLNKAPQNGGSTKKGGNAGTNGAIKKKGGAERGVKGKVGGVKNNGGIAKGKGKGGVLNNVKGNAGVGKNKGGAGKGINGKGKGEVGKKLNGNGVKGQGKGGVGKKLNGNGVKGQGGISKKPKGQTKGNSNTGFNTPPTNNYNYPTQNYYQQPAAQNYVPPRNNYNQYSAPQSYIPPSYNQGYSQQSYSPPVVRAPVYQPSYNNYPSNNYW